MNLSTKGAEYSTIKVPIVIPEKYQGQSHKFDIRASVKYPDGYGQQLIYRKGMKVGDLTQSVLRTIATAAITVALLPLVIIVIFTHPAGLTFALPKSVAPPK